MNENEQRSTVLDSSEPGKDDLTPLAGKRGGPRTPAGKQRSKYNAIKHGLYSKVLLLPDESPKEYSSLLEGLRDSFLPVGRAEELLVEKLANYAWRQRRNLGVEGEEIQRLREEITYGEDEGEELGDAGRMAFRDKAYSLVTYGGLLRAELNVEIVDRCVDMLSRLRDEILTQGWNFSSVYFVLQKIYKAWAPMASSLRTAYSLALIWPDQTNDEKHSDGLKKSFLRGIDDEISELRQFKETIQKYQAERKKRVKLRHSILHDPALDRLMRHEAHLSRLEDRTLSQLERLQRMRLGHPVPPPLKLEVSKN